MFTKNTPPANGLSEGPMMVACQWNMSSPTGPALQEVGGSFCRSFNSFRILFDAIDQTRSVPGGIRRGWRGIGAAAASLSSPRRAAATACRGGSGHKREEARSREERRTKRWEWRRRSAVARRLEREAEE